MRPVLLLHLEDYSVFSLTVCSLSLQFQNNKGRKKKEKEIKKHFQQSLKERDVI